MVFPTYLLTYSTRYAAYGYGDGYGMVSWNGSSDIPTSLSSLRSCFQVSDHNHPKRQTLHALLRSRPENASFIPNDLRSRGILRGSFPVEREGDSLCAERETFLAPLIYFEII